MLANLKFEAFRRKFQPYVDGNPVLKEVKKTYMEGMLIEAFRENYGVIESTDENYKRLEKQLEDTILRRCRALTMKKGVA